MPPINTDFTALQVSGPQAETFLQGQLTCDVTQISEQQGCLAAHCNPQGRIISLFRLYQQDQYFYLVLPANMTEITMSALKKYILFFKADIATASIEQIRHTIPAHEENILQGIPAIYPETSGKLLPHELNLQNQPGAIDFNKGCYTGQEIIARMHYRGKGKTHLYAALLHSAQQPQPGMDICLPNSNPAAVCGIIIDYVQEAADRWRMLIVTNEESAQQTQLQLADGAVMTLLNSE